MPKNRLVAACAIAAIALGTVTSLIVFHWRTSEPTSQGPLAITIPLEQIEELRKRGDKQGIASAEIATLSNKDTINRADADVLIAFVTRSHELKLPEADETAVKRFAMVSIAELVSQAEMSDEVRQIMIDNGILSQLTSPDSRLRVRAIQCLQEAGILEEYRDRVELLQNDPEHSVAFAAARALGL